MAQDQTTDGTLVVPAGPGWTDVPESDANEFTLSVADERFGPATIASVVAAGEGEIASITVGVELTLGDTLALIKRLEGIARQAILDGYADRVVGPYDPGNPLEEAAPFEEFEVELVGALPLDEDGIEAMEPVHDGDPEDYTRLVWTVYGYRSHTNENLEGEGATALYDADTQDEALAIARLLGAPVYLSFDGMRTLVND